MTRGRLAWLRITAWVIDWLCISAWALVLVPLGLLLRGVDLPVWILNAGSFLILVLPVTLWLAWRESARGATPGKRLRGLAVISTRTGRKPTFLRALSRNALKVALPWELGHTVAYGFATQPSPEPWLITLTIIVSVVMLTWLSSLFFPVSPYDALARTAILPTG
ncbi:RDD family protein [Kribbella sp. NPDC051952]|uniref:RDD family protein n=1 Tax=Kribbella sp. NPDC051952 TaxID=3154851 RepID=UPI00341E3A4C